MLGILSTPVCSPSCSSSVPAASVSSPSRRSAAPSLRAPAPVLASAAPVAAEEAPAATFPAPSASCAAPPDAVAAPVAVSDAPAARVALLELSRSIPPVDLHGQQAHVVPAPESVDHLAEERCRAHDAGAELVQPGRPHRVEAALGDEHGRLVVVRSGDGDDHGLRAQVAEGVGRRLGGLRQAEPKHIAPTGGSCRRGSRGRNPGGSPARPRRRRPWP